MTVEQDLNIIEYVYNSVANEYAQKFIDEHERKPKDQEILLRFSKEIEGKTPVWDFGCGPGQTAQYLKKLGVEVSGLDLSEKIIEQAKISHPDIYFQKGNMLKLEFENNSISGIVSFYSIVHFAKRQVDIFFGEVFRVLKSDGIFLFTYHIGEKTIHINEFLNTRVDIDFMFFNNDFIYNCLASNGFKNIEIIEREPYLNIEYQSRRAYVFAKK